MLASGLQLETAAHRSLDVEGLLLVEFILSCVIFISIESCDGTHIFDPYHTVMDSGGEPFGHLVGFHGQINLVLILSKHHGVVEIDLLFLNDARCELHQLLPHLDIHG